MGRSIQRREHGINEENPLERSRDFECGAGRSDRRGSRDIARRTGAPGSGRKPRTVFCDVGHTSPFRELLSVASRIREDIEPAGRGCRARHETERGDKDLNIFSPKPLATAAAAPILAGRATVATGAPANPAMMCKNLKSGSGSGVAKFGAKSKARKDWRSNVTGSYGPTWAKFSNAKIATFPCNKAEGLWYCNVRAQPCKGLGLTQ